MANRTEACDRSARERLNNTAWGLGVRLLHLGKRAGVSGPFESSLAKLATRVIRPPSTETVVRLASGYTLVVPPGFPRARTYAAGVYEPEVTSVLGQILAEGMTFVDVGAFCGYYTLLASHSVGDKGYVFAFEPDEGSFGYLTRNLNANGLTNVDATKAAVSAHDGAAGLAQHPEADHRWLTGLDSHGAVRVQTISLDGFFESLGWPPVDVMKIDVEGSETSVLMGMRELSRRNSRLQLIVEYDQANLARAGSSASELAAVLAELGFSKGRTVEAGRRRFSIRDGLPRTRGTYDLWLTKDTPPPTSAYDATLRAQR